MYVPTIKPDELMPAAEEELIVLGGKVGLKLVQVAPLKEKLVLAFADKPWHVPAQPTMMPASLMPAGDVLVNPLLSVIVVALPPTTAEKPFRTVPVGPPELQKPVIWPLSLTPKTSVVATPAPGKSNVENE
jgi:hypothetical protein